MANRKKLFLGETMEIKMTHRLTKTLFQKVDEEATKKELPMNTMMNQILYERYFGKKKK